VNIYFACSITGGRDFESVYQAITSALLSDGHEVPTAHLAEATVKELEGRVDGREIYERDTTWIRQCEALVAEVSTPSHGVGYEIAYALSLGKPVLCVHRKGQPLSKMLSGNNQASISVKSYSDTNEAIEIIRSFLLEQVQL
jgi:nucleoside 2-deoxyribosyltransferase